MSPAKEAAGHRRAAMLALFQFDAGRADEPESISAGLEGADIDDRDRTRGMTTAQAVWESCTLIDEAVGSESTQWPIHRQPAVDRAIMRLAAWELLHTNTPRAVVIDEAVRLAHAFGTEKSAGFINAVLDAMPLTEADGPESDEETATEQSWEQD